MCIHQEPVLQATQYLPDIVRLQHRLFQEFNLRLDRVKARNITIGEFISGKKSGKDAWKYAYNVCVSWHVM